MTDVLANHEGTVSIGGRTITNLRFADDIDGLAGEEEEMALLFERLDKASTAYGMEISAEETKLMTNNTSGTSTEIKVNRKKLKTVTSLKYLGSIITDEGSKPEILSKIAHTAALTRLKPVSRQTRQTEEEMGRQHQVRDRPGVCQVPEGSGEQRKMNETGCEIICGAPTTLAVKA